MKKLGLLIILLLLMGVPLAIVSAESPTITSASIADMDDGNNLYAMKGYYTFTTVVADSDANSNGVEKAPQLSEEVIFSLAVYNNKLYGSTGQNGKLYEWNGVDAWVEKASGLGGEQAVRSLAVYNNTLYGGTHQNGRLYEWNGVNAWVQVAPKLGDEMSIYSLAVFNNKLYGSTYPNGKLYEWNGVDAWIEKAPQLGGVTIIYCLAVYNGKLYGGTGPYGRLYEWNDVDAWVEKAPTLSENVIESLVVFNGKLYGGTGLGGKLYEWNGVDAWIEKAPQLGTGHIVIRSLAVYNDKLYGGTGLLSNCLYEWNGVDAWHEVTPQFGDELTIMSLAVYNGKLYGGTYNHGKLYEWTINIDVKAISIRGTQDASVRWMVNATNLNTIPVYTITSGSSVIDLDVTSCSFTQEGSDGTLVLKIEFKWNYSQENNCELDVWAQDIMNLTVGWTTVQTDYFDVINRLTTTAFIGSPLTVVVGGQTTIAGDVRYATSINGNVSSTSYPPDAQFTAVKIYDSLNVYYNQDTSIINGHFDASIVPPISLGAKFFYAYLDLVPDYTDGPAPDRDYVTIGVYSNFVPSQQVGQAFEQFGIIDYLIINAGMIGNFVAYFLDTIQIIVSSLLMLIGAVIGAGIFLIDWGTRIMGVVMSITGFIVDLWNGVASISTGLGNITTFFGVGQWIDFIPVMIIVFWIMSIDDREKKTGRNFLEISIGDIQTAYGILSIITGTAWTVYNMVVDNIMRFFNVVV